MKVYFPKKTKAENLSSSAVLAKNADRDLFFCALLAPPAKRELLFQIIAFWGELAKATVIGQSYTQSRPMAGYIRLQWWHDIVSGRKERHELATPLTESLDQGKIKPTFLYSMIEAREAELEGLSDWVHWQDVMRKGVGHLHRGLADIVEITDPTTLEQVECIGLAHFSARLRVHLPRIVHSGSYPLPIDQLSAVGMNRLHLKENGLPKDVLKEIAQRLGEYSKTCLDQVSNTLLPPPSQRAVFWPAVLAKRDLNRQQHPFIPGTSPPLLRPSRDWFAVLWARFIGRL